MLITMSQIYTILVLITAVKCVPPTRPYQRILPPAPITCDQANHTALIEHFFGLVYSDNHRPACVCVQMCLNQPAFCYPDGCMKLAERSKPEEPPLRHVSQSSSSTSPAIIETHVGLLNSLFENDLFSALHTSKEISDMSNSNGNKLSGSYKDKYKSLFKFKKTPKVHLRYNLREQAKNPKSDVINIQYIDVEKSKWQTSQGKHLFDPFNLPQKHNKLTEASVTEKNEQKSYNTHKYFKRDLNKAGNVTKIETDPVVEKAEGQTEANLFMLEDLIENLIESSFGPPKDTEIHLKVDLDNTGKKNLTQNINSTQTVHKNNTLKQNSAKIINESSNAVSINISNERINQHGCNQKPNEVNTKIYNDMIGNLTKCIDKLNNNSVVAMKLYLERKSNKTIPLSSEVMRDTIKRVATIVDADNNVFDNTTDSVQNSPETKGPKLFSNNVFLQKLHGR